mgnify:CR=1 FL=1
MVIGWTGCGGSGVETGEATDAGTAPTNGEAANATTSAGSTSSADSTPTGSAATTAGPATDATAAAATTAEDSSSEDSSSEDSSGEDSPGTSSSGSTTGSTTGLTTGSTTGALPTCGDGHVDPGEACDDGNDGDQDDDCTDLCAAPACGDGFVQPNHGEQCDDGGANDDGGACTTGCALAVCGDGLVHAGVEACDDGDDDDTDECVAGCELAACGDGFVHAGVEGCDDGNLIAGDGCSAVCKSELAVGKVFLTSANGVAGFYGFSMFNNTWATLASPPVGTFSQLTNDGEVVYLLGKDNVIYQYDIASDAWSPSGVSGPDPALSSHLIGYFKWTDKGFYYLKSETTTMHNHKNGAWTSFAVKSGSSAGSWDGAKNELYVRTHGRLGFQVISTLTNKVVRTIVDQTGAGEENRTSSYLAGYVYERSSGGPLILKLDAKAGFKTIPGVVLAANNTASDVDVPNKKVYFVGTLNQTAFERFNVEANSMTKLATPPVVDIYSTITVMLPP